MRYHAPVDPDCPAVQSFTTALLDDPMTHAMGAPVDEIMDAFERRHRRTCARCQEFGAANIEVQS